MIKYTLLGSMATQSCPRCRKGKLFQFSTYNLLKFTKMHKKCSCCGQDFEMEPSFYEGAMYVSYALQVAQFITIFTATQILYPEARIGWYLSSITVSAIGLAPLVYRLSRTIWIHFFVKFHKEEILHQKL